jgi:hypothetical protein
LIEPELRDAGHDHRRRRVIAAIEHDVALGAGQEKRGDVVGTDVIEVAGNAKRFDGFLPAALGRGTGFIAQGPEAVRRQRPCRSRRPARLL